MLGDTNSCLSAIARQAAAYSHFPHGGGKPLQGRVPAGGDQPPDCGHHLRRESGLFRTRPPIPRMSAVCPRSAPTLPAPPWRRCSTPNLNAIEASDIHAAAGTGPRESTFCCLPTGRRTSTPRRTSPSLFTAVNAMAEKYDMPILYSCHPRSQKAAGGQRASSWTGGSFSTSLWASMITTACR